MIDVIADPGMAHQVTNAHALSLGLTKHGIANRTIAPWEASDAQTVACWGWRIGQPLRRAGKRVLVMERGYIGDRTIWTSLGWNGLNGNAEYIPARDAERFGRYHGDLMQPWNPQGAYSLLIGQVEGDASLYNMPFHPWAMRTAGRMAKEFGLPVKFRPHPVAIEYGQNWCVPGAERLKGSLRDALAGAAVVVTFNSNAGVEAILAGKPIVTLDQGAMAWPVASHGWTIQTEPDRLPWANDVAWRQFTLEEIRNGSAWEHVGGYRG